MTDLDYEITYDLHSHSKGFHFIFVQQCVPSLEMRDKSSHPGQCRACRWIDCWLHSYNKSQLLRDNSVLRPNPIQLSNSSTAVPTGCVLHSAEQRQT